MPSICTNKNQWKNALQSQKNVSFLQTWEWGEFQRHVGNIPVRLFTKEGRPVQGFLQALGLGKKILYVPLVNIQQSDMLDLKKAAQELGVVFIRLEPLFEIKNIGRIVKNRQPQHSLILNISIPEEELLKHMHSKTRYNIRLAARKGVEIREEKDIDTFWKLNMVTTVRDGFTAHPKSYYKTMLEYDFAHQLTAYIEHTPVATLILLHFDEKAVYLHGASGNEYRNVMAPYLLQFEAIKKAKSLGASNYDFWGVADPGKADDPKAEFHGYHWKADHELTGVTRFKTGFGGAWKSYGEACEIPVEQTWDRVYQWIKKFR